MYGLTSTQISALRAEHKEDISIIVTPTVGSTITLTNANIIQGGFSVDRYCVSGDSIEIGSAIASEATVKIDNREGTYDDYIFEGAELYITITITPKDETISPFIIPIGYFTVDNTPRKLKTITLSALDRMVQFDKDYESTAYPKTIESIINDACSDCGIYCNTTLSELINYTQTVTEKPTGENLTYRQIIQWCAEITGTCAYIDYEGKLCFGWYEDDEVTFSSMVLNGNFVNLDNWTITGTVVSGYPQNNIIKIDSLTSGFRRIRLTQNVALPANHKYYYTINVKNISTATSTGYIFNIVNDSTTVIVEQNDTQTISLTQGTIVNLSNVFTTNDVSTSLYFDFYRALNWTCEFSDIYIYDMTALGIENYTLEQMETMLDNMDENSYFNAKSILPSDRFESDIQEKDIAITGVQVTDGEDVYLVGNTGYILNIEGNELIQSNHETIATNIYNSIGAFTYRPYECQTKNFPYLFPIDMVAYVDKNYIHHKSIITHNNFMLNGRSRIKARGKTATKAGYATQNPLTAREKVIIASITDAEINKKLPDIQQATLHLNELMANSLGLYYTEYPAGSGKWYAHDEPVLSDSHTVYTLQESGFAWTNQYENIDDPEFVWNFGFDKDGNAVLRSLTAYSISADYISGGKLTLGKTGNVSGELEVYNASNELVARLNNGGLWAVGADISGTVTIGGNDSSSKLIVKNEDNKEIIQINNENIYLGYSLGIDPEKITDDTRTYFVPNTTISGLIYSPSYLKNIGLITESKYVTIDDVSYKSEKNILLNSCMMQTNVSGGEIGYSIQQTAAEIYAGIGDKYSENASLYIKTGNVIAQVNGSSTYVPWNIDIKSAGYMFLESNSSIYLKSNNGSIVLDENTRIYGRKYLNFINVPYGEAQPEYNYSLQEYTFGGNKYFRVTRSMVAHPYTTNYYYIPLLTSI